MLFIDIVLFIIVMLVTGILYPVMGYRQSKKRDTKSGDNDKTEWYLSSIVSSWIPTIVILAATILNGHSLKDLGFTLKLPGEPGYLFYIALALSAIYLGYNIYVILLFRFNKQERIKHLDKIPSEYKFLLPSNRKERVMWRLLAITAGVTEEFIYRGYLFFALFLIFPEISPVWVILISSLLFSIGHIYQGKDVWKPATAGLFLSAVYYITGTIYIVIILHIIQDLVVGELNSKESKISEENHFPIAVEEAAETASDEIVAESAMQKSNVTEP